MSDTQRDVPVVYPAAVTPCPISCQNGDVDSNNAQITEVWTINSNTINEARFGYTYQGKFLHRPDDWSRLPDTAWLEIREG